MTDTYKTIHCQWCDKTLIENEVVNATKYTYSQDNAGNYTVAHEAHYQLCSFCNQFPRIDCMTSWQTLILNYALSDKSTIMISIDYNIETDNYTLNFIWYDNDQVRMGWIS